jgi:SagB-type dehydrogenase family enzyme
VAREGELPQEIKVVKLPLPQVSGGAGLAEVLARRRSVREYGIGVLTLEEIGQLLWAAQGVTDSRGFRTAPSAGATYPLETYLLTAQGLYHYRPGAHELEQVSSDDLRIALARACLNQPWVREAPAVFVFAAVLERTAQRYGRRAERYVHMEVGHAAQNLLLQAVALGLGGVPVGAFDDEEVGRVLALPKDERPLYVVPVGRRR